MASQKKPKVGFRLSEIKILALAIDEEQISMHFLKSLPPGDGRSPGKQRGGLGKWDVARLGGGLDSKTN